MEVEIRPDLRGPNAIGGTTFHVSAHLDNNTAPTCVTTVLSRRVARDPADCTYFATDTMMIERKHALGGASSGRRRFVTTFVVLLPCSLPVPYRLFATMSAAAKNVFIVAVRSAVRAHGVADSPHMLRLPVASVLHRPSVPRSAASVASSRTCLPRTWEPTRRRLRSLLARCALVVLPDCVRTADVCTDCTHRLTPAWWTLASSATSPRPFVLAHLHPAARSTCSYLVVALQS